MRWTNIRNESFKFRIVNRLKGRHTSRRCTSGVDLVNFALTARNVLPEDHFIMTKRILDCEDE
jgi:hypothetical protein